jgi:hypothetical protein
MLVANPFKLNLLHHLPLLHRIRTKNHFHDYYDFHHVLYLNHLFLGILIAMILFPKLNQQLILIRLAPFI